MPRTRNRTGDVDLDRDLELVDRAQHGDVGAFEELYLHYHDRVYRYCLRRLENRTEAEDAAQEAFARAWRALPNLTRDRRFYPWLVVIADNLCLDVARRNRRCSPVAEPQLEMLAPSVNGEQELLVDRRGERDLLSRAIGNLSDRHREVLELREGKNWTYQEIASYSGVEVSTIETLLFRARRSLRREFMQLARAEGALGVLLLPLFWARRTTARLFTWLRAWAGVAKRPLAGGLLPSGSAIGGALAALATTALVTASMAIARAPVPQRTPSRIDAAAVALPSGPSTAPSSVPGRSAKPAGGHPSGLEHGGSPTTVVTGLVSSGVGTPAHIVTKLPALPRVPLPKVPKPPVALKLPEGAGAEAPEGAWSVTLRAGMVATTRPM